jgi:hypothetical protein
MVMSMFSIHLQKALEVIDNAIEQLREAGVPGEVVIAALARQLYNRFQQRGYEF